MKIALISYEYPPDTGFGGIGTYAYQLAHMLRGKGHQVEVFAGGSSLEGSLEEEGILVHRIKVKQGEGFRRLLADKFAERHQIIGFDLLEGAEHKADALYIRQQFPEIPLQIKLHTPTYLLGRLFRGKVSFLDKARYMLGGLLRGRVPKAYWQYEKEEDAEYQLTKEADAILTPSLSLGDIAARDWQISREKIIHLPNLFVPHNMNSVRQLCGRSLLMKNGTIENVGNTDQIVQQYLDVNSSGERLKIFSNEDFAHHPEVSLESISIKTDRDNASVILSNEQDLHVELIYTLKCDITNFRMVIRLYSSEGTELFSATDWQDIEFRNKTRAKGAYMTTFIIPERLLNRGRYSLMMRFDVPFTREILKEQTYLCFSIEELLYHNYGYKVAKNEPSGLLHPEIQSITEMVRIQETADI